MTEGRGRGDEPTEGADQIIREEKTGEVVRRRRRRKEVVVRHVGGSVTVVASCGPDPVGRATVSPFAAYLQLLVSSPTF